MLAQTLLNERFGDSPEWGLLRVLGASLAIGLLLGLERERHADAAAGLRTFGLTALLGAVAAMLAELVATPAVLVAALLLVAATSVAAHLHPSRAGVDPGATTTVALGLCFVFGALTWHGLGTEAAAAALVVVALLYFKTELRGISQRLTRQDMLSILQFGTLSLLVLPVLPDRGYGPYQALNPHQIWLMVVLISGLSLAGYVALRLFEGHVGAVLVGLLGGLVSSTATTLLYARQARDNPTQAQLSAAVILLACSVVFIRVSLFAAIAAPQVLQALAVPMLAGFLPMIVAGLWAVRNLMRRSAVSAPPVHNPAELRTALGFGALYALILVLAAYLTQRLGAGGLYAVALASGLTDVDAIALSSLRLASLQTIGIEQAATAIVLAIAANNGLKLVVLAAIGGPVLARRCVLGFVVATVLLLGIVLHQ